MIMPAVELGTSIFTCLSLSCATFGSISVNVLVRSGFSLILSIMKSMTSMIASMDPVTKHTLSDVPIKVNILTLFLHKTDSYSKTNTWIEIVRLGHFNPSSRILLQLCNCLSTLADDGTSCHRRHQCLKVIHPIATWNNKNTTIRTNPGPHTQKTIYT